MSKKDTYDRIVDWFDVRFGFAKTPLKPIPLFTLNPIYWLGLLMALAFAIQGATGIFQLLYYVPTPADAYSSTMYVINTVPLGHLIETLHLYTAYAMILLMFMHLARNYFGSSHKEHRDLMWVAGIVMMFVVLGFGVTGYLLPWTVISKSATDVAIGFVSFLPGQLGNLARFLIAGTGSDADTLRRFVTLHTVLLPGALLALLAAKVYMYEVHGPSYVSAYGGLKVPGGKSMRWFPGIFLYATMVFSAFIALLFAASALVPLSLPPEFSAAAAAKYVVQPDWYLLWVYQILKFQVFEGSSAVYAVVGLGAFFVVLILLPFYDRSARREVGKRPVFITIGAILLSELIGLTVWGYLTPGQVIPAFQAFGVVGGLAVIVAIITWALYRLRARRLAGQARNVSGVPAKASAFKIRKIASAAGNGLYNRFTFAFVALLVIASVSLSSVVNLLPTALMTLPVFFSAVVAFAFSFGVMTLMLRNFVRAYEKEVSTR